MRFKLDNLEDSGGEVSEQDSIRSAASSSDGRHLVFGTIRGLLKVATLPTGSEPSNASAKDASHRRVQTLILPQLGQTGLRTDTPASTARACSFAWKDQGILAGYDDGSLAVWTQTADPGSSWRLAGCERSAHTARITCIAGANVDTGGSNPQEQVLAGSNDGTIFVWAMPAPTAEPRSGAAMRQVQTLSGGADDPIACIRLFDEEGDRRLYTATVAGQLSVWAWKHVDTQSTQPELDGKPSTGTAATEEWSLEQSWNLGPGTHPLLQVVVGDRSTVALVRLHSLRVCMLAPAAQHGERKTETDASERENDAAGSRDMETDKEGSAPEWTSSDDLVPGGDGAFIRAAAFNAEATLLAVCDWDGFLTLWKREAPGGSAWVRTGCCDAGVREAWSCVFGMGDLRQSVMVGSSDGTVAMKSTAEFALQKCTAGQLQQVNPANVTGMDQGAEGGPKAGEGEGSASGAHPASALILPPQRNLGSARSSKKEVPRLPLVPPPPCRLPLKPESNSRPGSTSRQKQRAKVETVPFRQPEGADGSSCDAPETAAESAGRLEAMWTGQGAEEHLSWHTVDPGEVDGWGRCLVSAVRRQKSWESVPASWWVQACMVRLPSQCFKTGVGPRVGDVVLCRADKGLHFDAEVLNVRVRKGAQEVKVLFLDGKQDEQGKLVRTFDWIPVANVSRVSKPVSLDFLRARLTPADEQQPPANRLTNDTVASQSEPSAHVLDSSAAEEAAAPNGIGAKGCVEGGAAMGDVEDRGARKVAPEGTVLDSHGEGVGGGSSHLRNEATPQASAEQGQASRAGETTGQFETVGSSESQGAAASTPPDGAAAAESQAASCQSESGAQPGGSGGEGVAAEAMSLRQVLQAWATAPAGEVARLKQRLRERHPALPSDFRILGPRPHVIIDGSGIMKYKVVVHPSTGEPSIEPISHVEWMTVARSIVSTKSLTRAADAEAYTASFTYARAQLPLTLEGTSPLAGAVRARDHFNKSASAPRTHHNQWTKMKERQELKERQSDGEHLNKPAPAPRTHHNQWTKMKERQELKERQTVRHYNSLLATRMAQAGLAGLQALQARSSSAEGAGERSRARPLTFASEGEAWWPPSLDHVFLPCWKDAAQRRPNPPAQVLPAASVPVVAGEGEVRVKRKYVRKQKKADLDAALLPNQDGAADGEDQPVLATVVTGEASEVSVNVAVVSEHGESCVGEDATASQGKATADLDGAPPVQDGVPENSAGELGEQDGACNPASAAAEEALPTFVTKTGRVSKLSPKGKKYAMKAMKAKINPVFGVKKKPGSFAASTKLSQKQLKEAFRAHHSASGAARDAAGASAEPEAEGLAAPSTEPSETVEPPASVDASAAAASAGELVAPAEQSLPDAAAHGSVRAEKGEQPLIPLGGDLSGPEDGEEADRGGKAGRHARKSVPGREGVKKGRAGKAGRSKIRKIDNVIKKLRAGAGAHPRKLALKELVKKTKARPAAKGETALADSEDTQKEVKEEVAEQSATEVANVSVNRERKGGKGEPGSKKKSKKGKGKAHRKKEGGSTVVDDEAQEGGLAKPEEIMGASAQGQGEKAEQSAKKNKSKPHRKAKVDSMLGKDAFDGAAVDGTVIDDEDGARADALAVQVVEGSTGAKAEKRSHKKKKVEGAKQPKDGKVDGVDAADGERESQVEEEGTGKPSTDDRPHNGKGEGKSKAGRSGSVDKGRAKAAGSGKASGAQVPAKASPHGGKVKAEVGADHDKKKGAVAAGAPCEASEEGGVSVVDGFEASPVKPSVGRLEQMGEDDIITPELLEGACVDCDWMLSNGWNITSDRIGSARPKNATVAQDVMHLVHMFVYASMRKVWSGTFHKSVNRERIYESVQAALKDRDYKLLNSALKRMEQNITWSCVTPPYEEKRKEFIQKHISGPPDAIVFLRTLVSEVLGRAWKVSVLSRMHKDRPILLRFVPDAKPKVQQQDAEGEEGTEDAGAIQQEAESAAESPKTNAKTEQLEDGSAKESGRKKAKAERRSKGGSSVVDAEEQEGCVEEAEESPGAGAQVQAENAEQSARRKSKTRGKDKIDETEAEMEANGEGALAEQESMAADRSSCGDERGGKRRESKDTIAMEAIASGGKDSDKQKKRKAEEMSTVDAPPSKTELPTTKSGRVVKPAPSKKLKTSGAQVPRASLQVLKTAVEKPPRASEQGLSAEQKALGEEVGKCNEEVQVSTEKAEQPEPPAEDVEETKRSIQTNAKEVKEVREKSRKEAKEAKEKQKSVLSGAGSLPPAAAEDVSLAPSVASGIAIVFGKLHGSAEEKGGTCADASIDSEQQSEQQIDPPMGKTGGKRAVQSGEKEAAPSDAQDGSNGSKRGKGLAAEAVAEANPSRRRKVAASAPKKQVAVAQREPNGVVAGAAGVTAHPSTEERKAASSGIAEAEAETLNCATEAAANGLTAGSKGDAVEASVEGGDAGETGAGTKRRRGESGERNAKNYISGAEVGRLVGEASKFLNVEADTPRATRASIAFATTKSGRKLSPGDCKRSRSMSLGQSAFGSPRGKLVSPRQSAFVSSKAKSSSPGQHAVVKEVAVGGKRESGVESEAQEPDRDAASKADPRSPHAPSGKKARKGSMGTPKEGRHEAGANSGAPKGAPLTESADSVVAEGKCSVAALAHTASSAAASAQLDGGKAPQGLQTPVQDIIPETP